MSAFLSPCEHVTWVRHREGNLEDTGRLTRLVREMTHPAQQYPRLVQFIGASCKASALRALFPHNRRRRKPGAIDLHLETTSINSASPLLFGDSNPFFQESWDNAQYRCHESSSYNTSWPSGLVQSPFDLVHARLLFLFSNVICVFADDFLSLYAVATCIQSWIRAGNASSLPSTVRPALLVVTSGRGPVHDLCAEDFRSKLLATGEDVLSHTFRSINLFCLAGDYLSPSARYLRLKEEILLRAQEVQDTRQQDGFCFSAIHLEAFFQHAVRHTALTIVERFDFIAASRLENHLHDDFKEILKAFFELCARHHPPYDAIASFAASSILMDAYPPRTHCFPSQSVFRALYHGICMEALEASYRKNLALDLCHRIEIYLEEFLLEMKLKGVSSATCHLKNIRSQYPLWSLVKTNVVCLLCLRHPPERVQSCGHSICDICVRRFGCVAPHTESEYHVSECVFCLAQESLIVDLKPKTAGLRVLTIDGGGVRGVIPLEYLICLENYIVGCPLHKMIDFAAGSSSGGLIIASLFLLNQSATECSRTFMALAKQSFGDTSGHIWDRLKAVTRYIITDAMYNEGGLEKSLQTEFTMTKRLFDHVKLSGTRIALTAISGAGSPVIMANYNGCVPLKPVAGYALVRPSDINKEPLLWEAGRATSAAPIFFREAELAAGSFADGGLGFPNPLEVAEWEWSRIWPDIKEADIVLPLGTGVVPTEISQSGRRSVKHLWQSFMSFLDGEFGWRRRGNTLTEAERDDYFRFNPVLPRASRLDSVKDITSLQQCVHLQLGDQQRLKTAAFYLLVSSFYFALDTMPQYINGVYRCQGSIRCRMDCRLVICALTKLEMTPAEYVTPSSVITCGNFYNDICQTCYRYQKTIRFDVPSQNEAVVLSLRAQNGTTRKISGFPQTMAWFTRVQGLNSPFGTPDHDEPGALQCRACTAGLVSKRKPEFSTFNPPKRRCI
ncbi:hypothetical protein AJ80_09857 [Polytolypa hystricis UAMH7299]|uniref:PNPLA domain-containing protein n=1 Tax=Polytolypa hystricis (strain UAMH7299) TaxID=1447883 RepID=A0A2B7W9L8_POLH7|nr:hypothetical protein AJ80_09857 [Polytolypa hystricis UAMH7299]